MLRVYNFYTDDNDFVVIVCHENIKEAKKTAFHHELFESTNYIDIRGKWNKNIDAKKLGLKVGLVDGQIDLIKMLKLGLYGCLYDMYCPKCNQHNEFIQEDEEFKCSDCGYDFEGDE